MRLTMRLSESTLLHIIFLCLSAASGCAALIYEIIWFQLLQLVIGSSAISLGILLAAFMGGMCLGSFVLPYVVTRYRHPLRIYALIELGIGAAGLIILFIIPYIEAIYGTIALPGLPDVVLRAAIGTFLLLPPTLLMGATLPAIARWMDTTPQGIARLGSLYAANLAGAVFGCLFAGFYLLRLYDTAVATYIAAAINLGVALIATTLAAACPYRAPTEPEVQLVSQQIPCARSVYITIALSGLTGLGAEVIWTRLLALLFGASVYTFSIILAVFLTGLGLGSGIGSLLVRYTNSPGNALGACQTLLLVCTSWSAYIIGSALPYWPVYPALAPSPWFIFQIDLFSCVVAIFPAALCWGASFPFALASVARGYDAGHATARIYAANTIGGVIGALAFSMILIPELGAQRAQQCLIAIIAAAAILILASQLWSLRADRDKLAKTPARLALITVVSLPVAAIVLGATTTEIPDKLVAFGRTMLMAPFSKVLWRGDGRVSSAAVTEQDSTRSFHVSGKVEASTALTDMRVERLLGHISALLHPKPRSVLVVGFGAGITAGSFTLYPEIERIVICEIEPIIPSNVGPYFIKENYDVLHNPRVTIVYDDARHYMATTKEKFDVITSDPIHPWVRGAATLYTQEYFESAKRRLNPGGVITQWVPLYQTIPEAVKSELATFFKVFPAAAIWSNHSEAKGGDLVVSGFASPLAVNVDDTFQRLVRPDYIGVKNSLREVGFFPLANLLATYVAQDTDLAPWLADAEINTDRTLRLQYLAGLGLNRDRGNVIYHELRRYRSLPPRLFTGSPENLDILKRDLSQ